MPDYAGKIGYSDMSNTDADGNTQPGFSHRSSTPKQANPKGPYQMPLTQEEQDILDGKKGPELAKVMKIVVAHGNAWEEVGVEPAGHAAVQAEVEVVAKEPFRTSSVALVVLVLFLLLVLLLLQLLQLQVRQSPYPY